MSNEKFSLVVAQEATNALSIFTSGNVDRLIGDIEGEVRSFVSDVDSAAGRKNIASLAHKVSRSKTALDALGKNLVGEWKLKSKAVDSERKQIRDRLDSLRDEVRAPLTEWEGAEKAKIEREKLAKELAEAHEQAAIEDDFFNRKKEIERKEAEQRHAEFDREVKRQEEIAEQKAKNDVIAAESARIEREEEIRQDAKAKAEREAEEQALAQKMINEKKIIEARVAEEKAKRDLEDLERRRLADLQEQEGRLKREQAEKGAEQRRKEAKEKAEIDRKAANKRHQKTINNGILKELLSIGISEDHAKEIIIKTAKKEIKNLNITY